MKTLRLVGGLLTCFGAYAAVAVATYPLVRLAIRAETPGTHAINSVTLLPSMIARVWAVEILAALLAGFLAGMTLPSDGPKAGIAVFLVVVLGFQLGPYLAHNTRATLAVVLWPRLLYLAASLIGGTLAFLAGRLVRKRISATPTPVED